MPRVQQKRGTAANLTAVDPTPLAGELLVVSDENTLIIGNGVDAYTSLAYVTATPRAHTQAWSTITDTPTTLSAYGITDAVSSSDARLTDSRTPTAHKASHATGGSDALSPSDIGAAALSGATFTGEVECDRTVADTHLDQALLVDGNFSTTTSALRQNRGIFGDVRKTVASGVTDTGYVMGCDFSGYLEGAGDLTDAYGLRCDAGKRTTSTGTLTNAYGVYSRVLNLGPSGAITNGYGVYIFDVQATNGWGVYQAGSNDRNFFAGNVGIGSGRTSPATALDVNGVITVSATSGSAGSYAPSLTFSGDSNTGFGQVSGQSDTASIFTAGQERVRVDASGNVLIGSGTAVGYADYAALTLRNVNGGVITLLNGSGTAYGEIAVTATATIFKTATSHPIWFGTNNAERMRLTAAGDLGLGPSRTAPASRLDVNGVITVSATSGSAGSYAPSLTFSGDSNTGFGQVSGQSDTASVFTAGLERLRVDASGNVGIGVSVDSNFNSGFRNLVVGNGGGARGITIYANPANAATIGFADGLSGGAAFAGFIQYLHADDAFSIGTNTTARVRISSAGHVGVLTESPSAALDINSDTIRLRTAKTPASASDTGNAGDICWDASYLYICTATNTWRRIAHSTW